MEWRILKENDRFYPQRKKDFLGMWWWAYETLECGMMDTQWSFATKEEAREYIKYKSQSYKKEIIKC